ncbi:ABC transporter ATP-binding protein [Streptomyces sp. NPDC004647]|uniref:ABC transporter ATP-binding protein n=1 Tax=Streptomyces sp. NPDC004647 TaxID=3154671 RepID=UPI0033B64392
MDETPAAAVLHLEGVSHRYGDREVLRSVSLHLKPAECVALVGHNGCGKSTLLRLAAGRETASEGEVLFDGSPLREDDPATRARISSVLDPAAYYPDLSVREHLVFVALAHGLGAAADETVDQALADHHLSDHATALPTSLSSGQNQLLLLASAFIRPHDLLLLDEPEQRLDSRARAELADRLVAHKERGAAVLMATHNLQLAERVADRVLVLESGVPVDAAGHEWAGADRAH